MNTLKKGEGGKIKAIIAEALSFFTILMGEGVRSTGEGYILKTTMSYRREKLEEQIKRIVSELLVRGEIKDPRIGFATVTGVELAKDYSTAKIGVSVLGDPRDLRKTLEGLKSATPYIQHRVGKSLGIRVTPKISFFLDSSLVEGVNMVDLLNRLEDTEKKEHEQHESGGEQDGEPGDE
jgi:ribosome-binding factor A